MPNLLLFTCCLLSINSSRWASLVAQTVKNLPANAGDIGDLGSIPGWGRFPGGEHGNPLQYSWPENPMGRGAWRATVRGGTKSQIQLSK